MALAGRALALVAFAYAVALAGAGATAHFAEGESGNCLGAAHPIAQLAAANLVGTAIVFAFSRAYDNSSFYDAYWSVAPMAAAPWLALGPLLQQGISVRKWLVILVVWIWGARLTWNWTRGWRGLSHEDWRYVDLRTKHPRSYWPVSFFGIHLFPTVCTFLGSLPMIPAMTSDRPVSVLDLVGCGIALGGTWIEAAADQQMRRHREGGSDAVCEIGLWRYSRHPNYFGECTFWVGLWVMGAAASPATAWWSAAGALVIIALFVFASIPMMEKRSLARRPAFAEHQRRVSMLVPWFRKP